MQIGKQSLDMIIDTARLNSASFSSLIFTHRQADPDALCAAYALSELIRKKVTSSNSDIIPSIKIIAPQGANLLAKGISTKFGINFEDSIAAEEIKKADLIVSVDTAEIGLLEPYAQNIRTSPAKKVLIDHHTSNRVSQESEWSGFETVLEADATSACEIVTLRFPAEYLELKIAKALLIGLLFDSQHLGIATESTLLAALTLVRAGARIDEAKELLRSRPERSEVIARSKSAQRLKYEEEGKFVIMYSEVSSFQAAVARMLLDIGGDVSLAFGDHEGEARISVRSSQYFFRETKIDLGELVASIAKELGLAGGGHSTAASMSGKTKSTELVKIVIKKIREQLPKY